MTVRRIALSLAAVLAFSLIATPAPADTSKFKAAGAPGSFHWQPDFRHIAKGDKIVWKNPTSATHTVTAWSGDWSMDKTIAPGDTLHKVFKKRGIYDFRCMQPGHSSVTNGECQGMCGEIHVQ
jgi:plastocyanin